MLFELKFDIVDVNTGEILTRNKQCSYSTDVPDDEKSIDKYVDCFKRGLKQGRNIALCISASQFQLPVQLNLF